MQKPIVGILGLSASRWVSPLMRVGNVAGAPLLPDECNALMAADLCWQ